MRTFLCASTLVCFDKKDRIGHMVLARFVLLAIPNRAVLSVPVDDSRKIGKAFTSICPSLVQGKK